MKILIDISDRRIHQLICGACVYWFQGFEWLDVDTLKFRLMDTGDDDTGPVYILDGNSLRTGLMKMAAAKRNEGGHHFADCMEDGNDDAWTGDALIQFACFGEMKYG